MFADLVVVVKGLMASWAIPYAINRMSIGVGPEGVDLVKTFMAYRTLVVLTVTVCLHVAR